MSSEDVTLTAGDAEVTVQPGNGCRIGEPAGRRHRTAAPGRAVRLLPDGPLVRPHPGRPVPQRRRPSTRCRSTPRRTPSTAPPATRAWRTARASADEAAFTYDLADPWPYAGRVTQIVALTEDALTLTHGRRDVRRLLPGAGRLAPVVPPEPRRRRGRARRLRRRLAGGARRRPPAHRQPRRPAARPLGRLLRHARRRRRHAHLARAAGAEGDQPRASGSSSTTSRRPPCAWSRRPARRTA